MWYPINRYLWVVAGSSYVLKDKSCFSCPYFINYALINNRKYTVSCTEPRNEYNWMKKLFNCALHFEVCTRLFVLLTVYLYMRECLFVMCPCNVVLKYIVSAYIINIAKKVFKLWYNSHKHSILLNVQLPNVFTLRGIQFIDTFYVVTSFFHLDC